MGNCCVNSIAPFEPVNVTSTGCKTRSLYKTDADVINKLFQQMDTDGDGCIIADDVSRFLKAKHVDILDSMFHVILEKRCSQYNRSDVVDIFFEFPRLNKNKLISVLFQAMDIKGTGYIKWQDLRIMIKRLSLLHDDSSQREVMRMNKSLFERSDWYTLDLCTFSAMCDSYPEILQSLFNYQRKLREACSLILTESSPISGDRALQRRESQVNIDDVGSNQQLSPLASQRSLEIVTKRDSTSSSSAFSATASPSASVMFYKAPYRRSSSGATVCSITETDGTLNVPVDMTEPKKSPSSAYSLSISPGNWASRVSSRGSSRTTIASASSSEYAPSCHASTNFLTIPGDFQTVHDPKKLAPVSPRHRTRGPSLNISRAAVVERTMSSPLKSLPPIKFNCAKSP